MTCEINVNDPQVQWTPQQLMKDLFKENAKEDMPKFRCLVMMAEDADFTVEQSKIMSRWLLDYVKEYRDSNVSLDRSSVWSALRTGASMLYPNQTNCLIELLEPGHRIDTVKVTVKMIGRIFEAQPPIEHEVHPLLSQEIHKILLKVLNPYAIDAGTSALSALSMVALVVMNNKLIEFHINTIKRMNIQWFKEIVIKDFNDLRNCWTKGDDRKIEACETTLAFLDDKIEMLGAKIS